MTKGFGVFYTKYNQPLFVNPSNKSIPSSGASKKDVNENKNSIRDSDDGKSIKNKQSSNWSSTDASVSAPPFFAWARLEMDRSTLQVDHEKSSFVKSSRNGFSHHLPHEPSSHHLPHEPSSHCLSHEVKLGGSPKAESWSQWAERRNLDSTLFSCPLSPILVQQPKKSISDQTLPLHRSFQSIGCQTDKSFSTKSVLTDATESKYNQASFVFTKQQPVWPPGTTFTLNHRDSHSRSEDYASYWEWLHWYSAWQKWYCENGIGNDEEINIKKHSTHSDPSKKKDYENKQTKKDSKKTKEKKKTTTKDQKKIREKEKKKTRKEDSKKTTKKDSKDTKDKRIIHNENLHENTREPSQLKKKNSSKKVKKNSSILTEKEESNMKNSMEYNKKEQEEEQEEQDEQEDKSPSSQFHSVAKRQPGINRSSSTVESPKFENQDLQQFPLEMIESQTDLLEMLRSSSSDEMNEDEED